MRFLPLLVGLVLLLVGGSIAFHYLYQQTPLGFLRALYITYCLIFMEHLLAFPEHWLLQVLYVVLPPLGMLVILDGVIRFSYHLLRRDETGEEWIKALCKTIQNHVVLCGLGKMGLRTLQQLIRLDQPVVVLERNPECPNIAFARRKGIPVRIGHSREEGVFDDLNVTAAKSIILATDDDLANLEMALDARKLNPEIRVVVRMFDQELAARLRDSLDLELTFSTSELAAPLFATCSSDRSIINSFYVSEQLLVVAKLTINPDSELVGRQIRTLGAGESVFCLSHTHAGEATMFPSAEAVLGAGDQITIQTEANGLKRMHTLNHDPEPY